MAVGTEQGGLGALAKCKKTTDGPWAAWEGAVFMRARPVQAPSSCKCDCCCLPSVPIGSSPHVTPNPMNTHQGGPAPRLPSGRRDSVHQRIRAVVALLCACVLLTCPSHGLTPAPSSARIAPGSAPPSPARCRSRVMLCVPCTCTRQRDQHRAKPREASLQPHAGQEQRRQLGGRCRDLPAGHHPALACWRWRCRL